jgi:hypothetical protein
MIVICRNRDRLRCCALDEAGAFVVIYILFEFALNKIVNFDIYFRKLGGRLDLIVKVHVRDAKSPGKSIPAAVGSAEDFIT